MSATSTERRQLKAVPWGAPPWAGSSPTGDGDLIDLPTPVVTVSEAAVEHNLRTMTRWCARVGVDLAPHGKTTMSRALWQRQLDTGAWGITVATPWQARVALDWGVPRVLLANELVQPAAIAGLAVHTDRLHVWADSLAGVRILDSELAGAGAPAPLPVLVDLGADGGRTGARTVAEGVEVARAIAAAPTLRLAGVAGYEGALAHDASDDSRARLVEYLGKLLELHERLVDTRLYPADGERVLTAGGSAYPDLVAQVLADRHDPEGHRGAPTRVVLRSGAYIVHDDGFYRSITPFRGADALRPALHAWATVLSRPEPTLAILDAGKRDVAFDEGLPEPQAVRRARGRRLEPLTGARVTALNDQHTFLEVTADASLAVGDVVRLGLSHPCTTFDKWRALPVLDDDRAEHPRVIGLLETTFG